MKAGEACGYCQVVLDTHCALHGQAFCDLQQAYQQSDTMTVDDVYDALYALATPTQLMEAAAIIQARVQTARQASSPTWITYWAGSPKPSTPADKSV